MIGTKTIYVDMDDVLCETARALLAIIEREFGKRLVYEQLYTFDVCEACGLQPHEAAEFFRIVHQQDELMRLNPIEESVPVLQHWSEAGHEIAIVTGRPPSAYEASIQWLTLHRLPYHAFIMVDKYDRFATADTMALTLSELAARRFCFAVEDSPTMARYLADEMKVPVALLDRPWNQMKEEHSLIGRYNHWHEIARAVPKPDRASK